MMAKHRDVRREASFHKKRTKENRQKEKRGEIEVEEIEHKQKRSDIDAMKKAVVIIAKE